MPAHRARVRMRAFLRDGRGARQFGIEMSIRRAQWMDDLIGVIMRNNRHRFLSAIRGLEIVMRNRPDWFECFSLGRGLRDWFGNHFRHSLNGDRRFFLRNRTYWFEYFFLGGDLRDRFGNN